MEMIVARSKYNHSIGKNNQLMWSISDDLKNFKKVTMGRNVIMGRKTFESLPNTLNGRNCYVITSQKKKNTDNVIFLNNIKEVFSLENPIIIGGESIYNYFFPFVEKIHLSEVNCLTIGDSFFTFSEGKFTCKEVKKYKRNKKNEYGFTYYLYYRFLD